MVSSSDRVVVTVLYPHVYTQIHLSDGTIMNTCYSVLIAFTIVTPISLFIIKVMVFMLHRSVPTIPIYNTPCICKQCVC